jgi:hypothetical protein
MTTEGGRVSSRLFYGKNEIFHRNAGWFLVIFRSGILMIEETTMKMDDLTLELLGLPVAQRALPAKS